jgi:hypothetical protein
MSVILAGWARDTGDRYSACSQEIQPTNRPMAKAARRYQNNFAIR